MEATLQSTTISSFGQICSMDENSIIILIFLFQANLRKNVKLKGNKTWVLSHPAICWIHYVQIALSNSKHLSRASQPSISAEHLSPASQSSISAILKNAQQCSTMFNNALKHSDMLINAQQCSIMLRNAQEFWNWTY